MSWSGLFLNLWGIFWMIIFFGGSIFIHEFGHFIVAKKRGLYVPKFSIGFGPRILSWEKGGTEYCISLFPLGGYVALPQMGEIPILEGKKTQKTRPLTFSDKFYVAVMGAVFNLLFAFVLACILWVVGLEVPACEQSLKIGYILPEYQGNPTPAIKAGLQPGDQIVAVDDVEVKSFSDIEKHIILGSGRDEQGNPQAKITYIRNGETYHVYLDLIHIVTNSLTKDEIRFSGIVAPQQDLIVGSFEKNSPAEKSGLKKGDKIVAVDGHPLYFPTDLKNYLNKTPELKQVQFLIERDKEIFNLSCEVESKPVLKEWLHYGDENNYIDFYISEGMPCILRSRGENFSKILEEGIVFSCNGIRTQNLKHFSEVLETYDGQTLMFEFEHSQIKHLVVCQNLKLPVTLHPVQTIQRVGILFTQPMQLKHDTPWMQFKQAISSTVETLSCLINKNTDVKVQHLMGAPGIMRLLHRFSIDDFRRLIWFMVILNINLAILNLLPLPVLDGGHILFAFIEKLYRRPLPQKVVVAIQNIFVFFFLALMLYVIFFDLRRWQGDVEKEKEQQYIEKLTIPVNTR